MTRLLGTSLGGYRLVEVIGQGGMASVYKALAPVHGRWVAVKVLSLASADSDKFIRRFQREAKLLSELDHAHIVPVEDFGEVEGRVFLVMRYLENGSLADRLRQRPLTPAQGARLIDQICAALQFAHEHGIVHRDVKPSNILLDVDENAHLTDFGLAHFSDASVSLTGSAMVGTPSYMSPEQAMGKPADPRSDQYSLGIVLYEMTTGRLPFESETPMGVVVQHISEPIPPPRSSFQPDFPEAVERVILKATAKDPEERFDSIETLNLAFQAAQAHALDPRGNQAPTIELPRSASQIWRRGAPDSATTPRQRFIRWGAGLAMLLALSLAVPVAARPAVGLLERMTSQRGNNALGEENLSQMQLTSLAGTIEAMSTDVMLAQADGMGPEQVQTAVAGTLMADDDWRIARSLDAVATATPDGTDVSAALLQPDEPTSTPSPGPSPTATASRTLGPTATRTPSTTPSPMGTGPASPTATAVTASPTATAQGGPPPMSSATPTHSPTPTFTLTPVPSSTPTTSACSNASLSSPDVQGKFLSWRLKNNGGSLIEITAVSLRWPVAENEGLQKIRLAALPIWSGSSSSSPTVITGGWMPGSRTVSAGESKDLSFEFSEAAANSGYQVEITLNNDCDIGAER